MTSALRLPRRARRCLAVAGVLAGLATTAGCEQPTPLVTVFAGGSLAQSPAQVWCRGSQQYARNNCAGDTGLRPRSVRVAGNDSVGIDVDEDLTAYGWYVVAGSGDKAQRSDIQRENFYRLPLGLARQPLDLQVVALDAGQRPRGLWVFTLTPG